MASNSQAEDSRDSKRRAGRGEALRFLESTFTHLEDDCIIWPFSRSHSGGGYPLIMVSKQIQGAHRIVCERFNGKPPSPKHEAAHTCGNGRLGCINGRHLRWATKRENENDKLAHGTLLRGESLPTSRLTESDVRVIRAMAGSKSQTKIAAQFGVGDTAISQIIRRITWRHI